MDRSGKRLQESLEAPSLAEAQQDLLKRGLMVLGLEATRTARGAASAGAGAETRSADSGRGVTAGARTGELALFTRQMAMMLRAGTSMVPAIQAINEQPGRPAWHALLADLAEQVEGGADLHEAMARHPKQFPAALRCLLAAGEATGTLPDAFARLSTLLEARQRLRRRVVSALAYPCVLLLMAGSVVVTMTTFVLPRFADLFKMLDTPLPAVTQMMLDTSLALRTWWPIALAVPIAVITVTVLWLRSTAGRRAVQRGVLRVPVVGRAVAGLLLARVLKLWAALVRSRVALLEAIRLGREATDNVVFRELVDEIEQAVSEGRGVATVLKRARIVPPPVYSAISTGEDSGRLGDSFEFAGEWLDEENEALVATITRAVEPAILGLMGIVVGAIAVALFLPLFDVATAAG